MEQDKDFDIGLSRKIRERRLILKLTQEQLAARMQTQGCDLTRSAIAKIEVGQRRISCRELKHFCIVLDMSYSFMLDD